MCKQLYQFSLIFSLVWAIQSCKPDEAKPLNVQSVTIANASGPDCGKADTLIFNCAEVKLSYPKLENGADSLRNAVDDWANEFMIAWLAMAEEPDNLPPLEEAITSFFSMHAEQVKEMPDAPAYYTAETYDTVLLNDGKYLTLMMDGYSFTGGAHPSASSSVATWEVATAQKITLAQLVNDLDALQKLAEKKFKEVRAELFTPGEDGQPLHQFDDAFPFKLADNIGLVKEGIYFCYVPYEVGPYSIGPTEFVLTYPELKGLLK